MPRKKFSPNPRIQTPKQKRASERNWHKAQVMSAANVCNTMAQKGRSAREKDRAMKAAEQLSDILANWNNEEHL